MQDVQRLAEFWARGGTELAPMSTTTDIAVAIKYAASRHGLLRVRKRSAVERGADISYLSAFSGERERLLPPLTYLQPIETGTGE
jgi:hypothetical protein